MMKKLYLFDFDGTLTYKDTMFLFLKFYDPAKFSVQFLKHVPLFILLKMKLADAEAVKKSLISSILRGQSKYQIEKKHNNSLKKTTQVCSEKTLWISLIISIEPIPNPILFRLLWIFG